VLKKDDTRYAKKTNWVHTGTPLERREREEGGKVIGTTNGDTNVKTWHTGNSSTLQGSDHAK
jgi:hypothetical protein